MTIILSIVGGFILGVTVMISLIYLATDRYKPRKRDPERRNFYRALSEAMLAEDKVNATRLDRNNLPSG